MAALAAGLAGALALAAAGAAIADAGKVPGTFHRPQVDVARDPPAWYADTLYHKMDPPRPGDWKAAHPEPVQSFRQYVASRPNRPTPARHTLVLAPLGTFSPEAAKRTEPLREYLETYYTLPVSAAPPAPLKGVTSRQRRWGDRRVTQYLTGDILGKVLPPRVDRGTFSLLAVTMEDLYPEDSWNYVFGQASLADRVGVYSLVRFYPEFWGEPAGPEAERRGLKRSLATLVHETGHMFGVHHCQTFDCVLNGSNSLAESDRRPLHLCPECLKKFRWNIGFDVPGRYEALRAFYEKHGFEAEAAWVAKRLAECRADPAARPAAPPGRPAP
jgi:archaemetzincin